MQKVSVLAGLFSFVCLLQPVAAPAGEWPQYRGPNLDGVSTENVSLVWSSGGPKEVWKIPTPNGFSSFSVSGGKVFTQVTREVGGVNREIVVAMDAGTGKELWFAPIDLAKYDGGGDDGAKDNKGGDGPRSTPTVNDGLVYALNQHVALYCFDPETGKQLWVHDVVKENKGREIHWKSAASPVIDGDLVFVVGGGAGQSLLAFNKKTGEVAWKAFDETMNQSTPVVGTILGQRQVIFFVKSGLLAVSPKDGKELWRFPFTGKVSTAISPVICGDIVYCSCGYGVGSSACRIAKDGDHFTATKLYMVPGDDQIANHWSTPIYKDGYLYGMFSFKKYSVGPMKCVDVATGKVIWTQPGFGAGNVTLVNDKLVALADDGQLVIVDANPAGYKELARAKVITGKCWSTPAVSDGKIYVRSTKEGACLDVSGK